MSGQTVSHCTPQLCNPSHESTDDKLVCKCALGNECLRSWNIKIVFNFQLAQNEENVYILCSSKPAAHDRLHNPCFCVWGGMCKLFVGQWHKEMYAWMPRTAICMHIISSARNI